MKTKFRTDQTKWDRRTRKSVKKNYSKPQQGTKVERIK